MTENARSIVALDDPVADSAFADSVARANVVLAEAHPLLRTGLRAILEREPTLRVVSELTSGPALLAEIQLLRPDAVVTDIGLPDLDLAQVIHSMQGSVLLLGDADDTDDALQALRAGAHGFAVKNGSPGDLLSAVRAVASGQGSLTPNLTGKLIDWFASGAAPTVRAELVESLTPREREVLQLVAEGLSNDQIARVLVLRTSTVKSHVYHLLRKLGLHHRAQAVAFAYRTRLAVAGADLRLRRGPHAGSQPLGG